MLALQKKVTIHLGHVLLLDTAKNFGKRGPSQLNWCVSKCIVLFVLFLEG